MLITDLKNRCYINSMIFQLTDPICFGFISSKRKKTEFHSLYGNPYFTIDEYKIYVETIQLYVEYEISLFILKLCYCLYQKRFRWELFCIWNETATNLTSFIWRSMYQMENVCDEWRNEECSPTHFNWYFSYLANNAGVFMFQTIGNQIFYVMEGRTHDDLKPKINVKSTELTEYEIHWWDCNWYVIWYYETCLFVLPFSHSFVIP